MTLSRYEHTGAAPATGLAAGISSSATSFTVLSGTGYPTGSVGDFVICLDPGTSSEEKILCSARSGTAFTVASGGRGYDGTSAASHSAGTTNVTHVLSAAEVDDTSAHIYDTTRNDHTQYVEGSATPGGDLAGSGSTYTTPVLKASGVTAGTYTSVTVNAKGLVTAGTNPGATLLKVVSYNPTTAVTGKATSSTTLVAVDTTNLTISFIAPSSGNVLVKIHGGWMYTYTGSDYGAVGLLDHTAGTQVGSISVTSGNTGGNSVSASIYVTGLTSGSTYQYDLAYASPTSPVSQNLRYGGGPTSGSTVYGALVMEVWSA